VARGLVDGHAHGFGGQGRSGTRVERAAAPEECTRDGRAADRVNAGSGNPGARGGNLAIAVLDPAPLGLAR